MNKVRVATEEELDRMVAGEEVLTCRRADGRVEYLHMKFPTQKPQLSAVLSVHNQRTGFTWEVFDQDSNRIVNPPIKISHR